MPSRGTGPAKLAPCGNPNRSPLDVAGRINDLINCYLVSLANYTKAILPEVILGVILLAIMILAAREFIKE